MNYRMLLARAAFCGLGMIGYAYGGVLTNVGFEDGTFAGWTLNNAPNYTSVTNSGCPSNCAAHGGSYFAQFGNDRAEAGISQPFDTVAGYNYTVEFWLSVDPNTANVNDKSLNSYSVLWDSTVLANVANAPRGGGWQKIPLNAISTSSTSRLTFQFYDNLDAFGLDDVSVTQGTVFIASAVPEPVSLILAGTSLIALAGLSRLMRRRR